MDGTKEGIPDGSVEGVVLGELEGEVDGTAVEGEELGKAVTSKFRQTSLTSQQTLQHLQTTSAGLSPSISARQSDESSSIIVSDEHSAFGTPPVRTFLSSDTLCNEVRKPSWRGIASPSKFPCNDRFRMLSSCPNSEGMLPESTFPDKSRVNNDVSRPTSDGIGPDKVDCGRASSKPRLLKGRVFASALLSSA